MCFSTVFFIFAFFAKRKYNYFNMQNDETNLVENRENTENAGSEAVEKKVGEVDSSKNSPVQEEFHFSTLLGIVVIVAILVSGAWFFWNEYNNAIQERIDLEGEQFDEGVGNVEIEVE
jgi:hypothetical protein